MKRLLLILILLAAIALPVLAGDCGNGLPCGPLGWTLPPLPVLPSPTFMPTLAITAIAPTQVSGAVPTAPAIPTAPPLVEVDTSGIGDQMATLNAVVAATSVPIVDLNGTPVDTDASFTELGDNAGQFFGYARSLSEASVGELTPLLAFGLLSFVVVIAVKIPTYLLPIAAAVFGLIRKIVQVILEFIPL